jgi:hypothetical protein
MSLFLAIPLRILKRTLTFINYPYPLSKAKLQANAIECIQEIQKLGKEVELKEQLAEIKKEEEAAEEKLNQIKKTRRALEGQIEGEIGTRWFYQDQLLITKIKLGEKLSYKEMKLIKKMKNLKKEFWPMRTRQWLGRMTEVQAEAAAKDITDNYVGLLAPIVDCYRDQITKIEEELANEEKKRKENKKANEKGEIKKQVEIVQNEEFKNEIKADPSYRETNSGVQR